MKKDKDMNRELIKSISQRISDSVMDEILNCNATDSEKIHAICNVALHLFATQIVNVAANLDSPCAEHLKINVDSFIETGKRRAFKIALNEGDLDAVRLIGSLINEDDSEHKPPH